MPKSVFPFFYGGGQELSLRQLAFPFHPVSGNGHLGREDIACLQLLHPAQRLARGKLPRNAAVPHQHHMLAVIGDIFRMVLDDDNRLAMLFVQLLQYAVDFIRMAGIQLGDRLVQNQDIRPQGNSARQRQQMGLPPGKLPDIVVFPSLQPAEGERSPPSFDIIRHGVVQAGIGSVIQHGRADDLIFKILIDISRLAGQRPHIRFQGVDPSHLDGPFKIAVDKVRDQPV